MSLTLRAASWITCLGLAACSPGGNNATPAATDSGHRYLLTPASGELLKGYGAAGMPGSDQPMWVAATFDMSAYPVLLARLDTAGQPLVSRLLRLPGSTAFNDTPLALAALADGGSLLAQYNSNSIPLVRSAASGAPVWSKMLTLSLSGSETLFLDGIAAVGSDALYVSRTSLQGPLIVGRIPAFGTQPTAISYAFPAPIGSAANQLVRLAALPAGDGVVFVRAQDDKSLLIGRLDAGGQPVWARQLTLGNLGGSKVPDLHYDLAVASGGSLGIMASTSNAMQLVRLSASGTLLAAVSYVAATSGGQVAHLALGPQNQAGWTFENGEGLFYYQVDDQNRVAAARKVSPKPTYSRSPGFGGYGIVGFGARGAYALGTLAGPAPNNLAGLSLNFLHLSATGRAGCQLDAAPTLTTTPVPDTQLTTLPLPTGLPRPVTLTDFTLNSAAAPLTSAPACQ